MNKIVQRRPFLAFAVIGYSFSWTFWIIALFFTDGIIAQFFYHLAGFGPMVAAIVVLKMQRRYSYAKATPRTASTLTLRSWLKSLFKWRLHPLWYLFAFGFPILLIAIVSLIYTLLGNSLELSLLPSRLVAYLPLLLVIALIRGGNEEPGWRGFGLPVLQQRYPPMVATCILGLVWAFWHLPLLASNPDVAAGTASVKQTLLIAGVTLVSITTHAFWYTWLMNRTGSVLLCIILHASYNAANGLLLLVPEAALRGSSYQLLLLLMTSVLIISVIGLLVATRGRLDARKA